MQIVVSGVSSTQIIVEQETHQIVLQRPQTGIVELTTPGPQGPAFTGQQFFNISSIASLSAADSGSTLKWDGSQFVPASELSEGLTVFCGAF